MGFTQQRSGPHVPHLMILRLSSFLAVQVTVNFLLKSLMPGVKSSEQSQWRGARTAPDGRGMRSTPSWEEWAPHCAVAQLSRWCPLCIVTQTLGSAVCAVEDTVEPQAFEQWWTLCSRLHHRQRLSRLIHTCLLLPAPRLSLQQAGTVPRDKHFFQVFKSICKHCWAPS